MRKYFVLCVLANLDHFSAIAFLTNTGVSITPREKTSFSYSNKGNDEEEENNTTEVVIIGSGWAGYSAAESLSQNIGKTKSKNLSITLLDASKNSGGLAGGFKTVTGRKAEAGIHGFWREYTNTFSIMDRIEGVDSSKVLGDFTPSVLFSKNGRVALAPVLGNVAPSPSRSLPLPPSSLKQLLIPPLDIALLAQFDASSPLTSVDRLSALGLLGPWADFQQESPESWSIYDRFSAKTLFREKAGVRNNLYEELIEPLLSVLPMCPDYDCSAAAALSCFHVFALQSRGAFDVKWCRGSITEQIFNPWREQLSKRGVEIRNNSRVVSVHDNSDATEKGQKQFSIYLQNAENNPIKCDAIVFAVGGTAMGFITKNSPALKKLQIVQDKEYFQEVRGVTCVAVRLFLEPHKTITSGLRGGQYDKTSLPPDVANAMKDSPIAVCGPNPSIGKNAILQETGFCIYDLQRMHDEFSVDGTQTNSDDSTAVIEIDFYRADKIADMNDDEIANLALEVVAATFKTKLIESDNIIDLAVVRARNAVSHFAPNSASWSPQAKLGDGIYICGDWIDRSGHASWSTEKAVVTGIQAASALSKDYALECTYSQIIDAPKDTEQLAALREVAAFLRKSAPPELFDGGIPRAPWVFPPF